MKIQKYVKLFVFTKKKSKKEKKNTQKVSTYSNFQFFEI